MKKLLFYFIILLSAGACVPAKKLVYLQHENELNKKKEIPRYEVLREHNMAVEEYRIQPLDMLHITFESITDESLDFFSKVTNQQNVGGGGQGANMLRGVMVDKSGNIEYPVVGKIHVAGLSIFEAQDKVQQITSDYLRDAVVRIRLLNFRFTVLGEVRNESVINSMNTRITFMEAVGMAGGLTELADRSFVKVIRQREDTSEVFFINLLEEEFIEEEYYFVQQNDIIVVPPLEQRTFKKYFTQNLGIITTVISSTLFIISITNDN